MTLLELLVATLLASLLFGSLVGFMALLEKHRSKTLKFGNHAWKSGVFLTMESDLMGAREIRFENERLTLVGNVLDAGFGKHLPQEIVYELHPQGSHDSHWLVRRTRPLGRSRSSGSSILCGNILKWHVQRIDERGELQPLSLQLSPSPARMHVQVWIHDGPEPMLEEWTFVAN